jgi:hypothetical protein
MTIIKYIIIGSVFKMSILFGQELICPEGTSLVSLPNLNKNKMTSWCSLKQSDGSFVKHGPEKIITANDQVILKNYQYGTEVLVNSSSEVKAPVSATTSDPQQVINLMQSMIALMFNVDPTKLSSNFNYRGCSKIYTHEMAQLILQNKQIIRDFKFETQCDLEGRFIFAKPSIPSELKLRNAGDLTEVKFKIDLTSIAITPNGIDIELTFPQTEFKTQNSTIEATAFYKFQISLSGQITNDYGGNIQITKMGGVEIIKNFPLAAFLK